VHPGNATIRLDVGGVVLEGSFPRYEGESAMYSPRRTVLDPLLVDAARSAGADVREKFRAKELVWANSQVVGIRGSHGAGPTVTETAHLVVGADGKHSMVAHAVRAPQYRHRDPMTIGCYSYWSGVPVTMGELYQRPGCAAAAFPTNEELTMVYVAVPIREFPSFRTNIEDAYLNALDQCGDVGERVRSGRRIERIRTTPDLPNYVRVPYGPGWALIGDAGLVINPVTAQGIGNAFADAERLANAIVEGFDRTAPLPCDAGIIPVSTYYSARNFVRILGFRDASRAMSAVIRASGGSRSTRGWRVQRRSKPRFTGATAG
jgi:flavin-dependent dehydrogenase